MNNKSNLLDCPDCGHIVSIHALYCPACGAQMSYILEYYKKQNEGKAKKIAEEKEAIQIEVMPESFVKKLTRPEKSFFESINESIIGKYPSLKGKDNKMYYGYSINGLSFKCFWFTKANGKMVFKYRKKLDKDAGDYLYELSSQNKCNELIDFIGELMDSYNKSKPIIEPIIVKPQKEESTRQPLINLLPKDILDFIEGTKDYFKAKKLQFNYVQGFSVIGFNRYKGENLFMYFHKTNEGLFAIDLRDLETREIIETSFDKQRENEYIDFCIKHIYTSRHSKINDWSRDDPKASDEKPHTKSSEKNKQPQLEIERNFIFIQHDYKYSIENGEVVDIKVTRYETNNGVCYIYYQLNNGSEKYIELNRIDSALFKRQYQARNSLPTNNNNLFKDRGIYVIRDKTSHLFVTGTHESYQSESDLYDDLSSKTKYEVLSFDSNIEHALKFYTLDSACAFIDRFKDVDTNIELMEYEKCV